MLDKIKSLNWVDGTMTPDSEFWNLWRSNKGTMKSLGVKVTKDEDKWIATFTPPTSTVEESRKLTSDLEVPAPNGLEYFGYQKAGIEFIHDRNALLADDMGTGKGAIHGSKVYTPSGPINIEDLKVGDYVFGSDGNPTRVSGTFYRGELPVFRVTFNDGFHLDVDGDHLWAVSNHPSAPTHVIPTKLLSDPDGEIEILGSGHNANKRYKTKTFYKRSNGNNRWSIPLTQPVSFVDREVPMDPYLLGVILGDGSIGEDGSVLLTLPSHKLHYLGDSVKITPDKRGHYRIYLSEYKEELRELGLLGKRSWEKFIPELYKYNNLDVRLAILRGLMDTDGHPEKNSTEYSTSSEKLCNDVVEITQSLGGIARVKSRIPKYTYQDRKLKGRLSYRVNIKLMQNPFRYREMEYTVPTKYLPNRYITDVKLLPDKQEVTCISIEAENSLYIAEHFIVTHNTIQTAGAINMNPDYRRVLVVCPNSLKLNWKRELEKWLVVSYRIGVVDRNDFPEDVDILIINYDVVDRHKERLQAEEWDLLVLDEAHAVKNDKAKRTQAILGKGKKVSGIPAKRKLFLTGTPVLNRPMEFFTLLNALDPEEWSNKFKYGLRYCNGHQTRFGWDFSGASNLEELNLKLRTSIMIRRTKEEALPELPPVFHQVVELPQDATLRKLIKEENKVWEDKADVIAELRAAVELARVSESKDDYHVAVKSLQKGMNESFADMARVRQEIAIAKTPYLLEHLKELDKKVVVFFHHKEVGRQLLEALGDGAVILVGDTKLEDRQEAVDRFQNDPKVKYFLGSITAAGVGITLTASSHVVFHELDYRPAMINQAWSRCQRIGQKDNVLVQYFLVEGSLDAKMANDIVSKQEIIDRILDDEVEIPSAPDAPVSPTNKELETEVVPEAEKQELLSKLRILAALDQDFAQAANNMGFNKADSRIGHSLASQNFLSNKQAVLARRICHKYRRQLE